MIVPGHPLISANAAICGGKPVIGGTRIRVADILGALAAGDTVEELVADFDSVDEAAIRACLAYAADVIGNPVALAAE